MVHAICILCDLLRGKTYIKTVYIYKDLYFCFVGGSLHEKISQRTSLFKEDVSAS